MKLLVPYARSTTTRYCNGTAPLPEATEQSAAFSNDAETVLAETPFLLARCSSDLRYVFVSEAYARTLGHRARDVAGKKIIDVMGEKGFKTIKPHVEAVLSGARVEFETVVHFEGIGPRLLHVIYTPDRDRSGNVRGWIASIVDITEQQQAQNQIATDLHATTLLREIGAECVRDDRTAEQCLEKILEVGIVLAKAQKGNLQLFNDASRSLHIVAQRGFGKPFINFFQSVTEGASACGGASRSGTRVIVSDVLASEIFVGQPSQKILLAEQVRAVISTPLVSSSGHILGMLSTHFNEPHEPQSRELHFLDLLARLAADYLERKRHEDRIQYLFKEVNHRSRNILALVQAIARQSAPTTAPQDFISH